MIFSDLIRRIYVILTEFLQVNSTGFFSDLIKRIYVILTEFSQIISTWFFLIYLEEFT